MLEKPAIQEETIAACLQTEYSLVVERIVFLPLGADQDTAVYRVETADQIVYFLKLRRGEIFEPGVLVPNYLKEIGIQQVIAALPTRAGALYTRLAPFTLILYPFVNGQNGFEQNLSDAQWLAFGAAVKAFHSAEFPPALTRGVPTETFSAHWRDGLRQFLEGLPAQTTTDPASVELATFLKSRRADILALLDQCERLAVKVKAGGAAFILCHADMHAWNLLLDAHDAFYIVDWDTLIYAPKERDLMFIGAGLQGFGRTAQQEARLFYQGYGPAEVDPDALAYYRYARIIEDIAVYCEQIFLSDAGGEDRTQAVENVKSIFLPDGPLQIARQADQPAENHVPLNQRSMKWS